MSGLQSDAVSRYLAWAKLGSSARFNLASSGVLDYPLAELRVRIEDLEIGGTGRMVINRLWSGWLRRPECPVNASSTP